MLRLRRASPAVCLPLPALVQTKPFARMVRSAALGSWSKGTQRPLSIVFGLVSHDPQRESIPKLPWWHKDPAFSIHVTGFSSDSSKGTLLYGWLARIGVVCSSCNRSCARALPHESVLRSLA